MKLHPLIALALPAASLSAASIYSEGHGDIRIVYDDGALEQSYSLDNEALVDGLLAGPGPEDAIFEPTVLLTFIPDLPLERPPGAEFDFLGNAEGQPLWLIPEVQEFDRPWLGFSSESLTVGDWSSLEIAFIGMTGPAGGQFSLSQSGFRGELTVCAASFDGIDSADRFGLTIGSHAHYNWVFTEPGLYELTFEITGDHVTDGLRATTATYTFGVAQVPEPSAALLVPLASFALCRRRRLHPTLP